MALRRLLITGSRAWNDRAVIRDALRAAFWELGGADPGVILVSGACPDGADAICEEVWAVGAHGCPIERHPAEWDRYGRSAGFRRNAEMVGLGADLCLAFIVDESRGASHTARLAWEAGIPTRRYLASSSAG